MRDLSSGMIPTRGCKVSWDGRFGIVVEALFLEGIKEWRIYLTNGMILRGWYEGIETGFIYDVLEGPMTDGMTDTRSQTEQLLTEKEIDETVKNSQESIENVLRRYTAIGEMTLNEFDDMVEELMSMVENRLRSVRR